MKKLLAGLLSLVMIGAYAGGNKSPDDSQNQENQEKSEGDQIVKVNLVMMCLKPDTAQKLIQQQKQHAVFVGLDKIHGVENLSVNIFQNQNSGSYTIGFISLDKDLVCFLSAGEGAKFLYNN